jgi:LuxR family transcriptional regulator, maltose regulon positive regulatory protein
MAQSLYVAPNTVRTQVKSLYRKLGVSSRKEAVEEAHVRGFI